jgi:hypothetical protein
MTVQASCSVVSGKVGKVGRTILYLLKMESSIYGSQVASAAAELVRLRESIHISAGSSFTQLRHLLIQSPSLVNPNLLNLRLIPF